jgi:hypothetical protein
MNINSTLLKENRVDGNSIFLSLDEKEKSNKKRFHQ